MFRCVYEAFIEVRLIDLSFQNHQAFSGHNAASKYVIKQLTAGWQIDIWLDVLSLLSQLSLRCGVGTVTKAPDKQNMHIEFTFW